MGRSGVTDVMPAQVWVGSASEGSPSYTFLPKGSAEGVDCGDRGHLVLWHDCKLNLGVANSSSLLPGAAQPAPSRQDGEPCECRNCRGLHSPSWEGLSELSPWEGVEQKGGLQHTCEHSAKPVSLSEGLRPSAVQWEATIWPCCGPGACGGSEVHSWLTSEALPLLSAGLRKSHRGLWCPGM